MQWIAGRVKLADALTKRNSDLLRRLNEIMAIRALEPFMFKKAKRIKLQ